MYPLLRLALYGYRNFEKLLEPYKVNIEANPTAGTQENVEKPRVAIVRIPGFPARRHSTSLGLSDRSGGKILH